MEKIKSKKIVLLVNVYFPSVGLVEANTVLTENELSINAMEELVQQHAAIWKVK